MTKAPCKEGDRIELLHMPDDPCPIEPGSKGTVTYVSVVMDRLHVGVKWDSGRTLSMVWPVDSFRVIEEAQP